MVAEFRELPRIVNELAKHPERFKVKDIPKEFTLNKGHVTFYRNKLLYLKKRHASLTKELSARNINFSKDITVNLEVLAPHIKMFACNDWTPSKRDHSILIERLDERFALRKKAYHLTKGTIKEVINTDESYITYRQYCLEKYIK